MTDAISPRILTREQAAAYCGLTVSGFADWISKGRLPGRLKGTNRWDKAAIDLALDLMSGIDRSAPPPKPSSLATWIEKRDARRAAEAAARAEAEMSGTPPTRGKGRR